MKNKKNSRAFFALILPAIGSGMAVVGLRNYLGVAADSTTASLYGSNNNLIVGLLGLFFILLGIVALVYVFSSRR